MRPSELTAIVTDWQVPPRDVQPAHGLKTVSAKFPLLVAWMLSPL
jgi:hypothetical protein